MSIIILLIGFMILIKGELNSLINLLTPLEVKLYCLNIIHLHQVIKIHYQGLNSYKRTILNLIKNLIKLDLLFQPDSLINNID